MDENPSDLVGKEFIFEYGVDRIMPPSDKNGGIFTIEQRAYRRERVVRCRDCGRAYRRSGGVYCSSVLQWGEQRQTGSSAGGPRRLLRVGRGA